LVAIRGDPLEAAHDGTICTVRSWRLVADKRIPYLKVTRSKRIFELSEYCIAGGDVGG
jgi:hypothetical protein